jgi:glycosyltransferase involved in cell wall biosynthesis
MRKGFSIALATFNGAKYLPPLLESIAAQRLLPYELVASDDASSDETLTILSDFTARAPFPVRFVCNKQKLGVTQNFANAIAACSGDQIALADQDDVWRNDKLEKLTEALARPGALAAFSDADVVDARLMPLGYTMWQRVRFTQPEQNRLNTIDGFSVLIKHHVVTGATLAFNASLRDIALPIPDGWPHDAWLALLATALSQLMAIPEPLLAYRQHSDNVVGGLRMTFLQEARAALAINRSAWYREELSLWRSLEERLGSDAPLSLSKKIAHLKARADMPDVRWRRLPHILREVASGRYKRFARNWGSIAVDLFVK